MNCPERCLLKKLSFFIRRMVLLVSFIPVLLMSCTPARMAVHPQLVSVAKEMKVEGRKSFSFDEAFFFGPYQVTEVHRGWTRSTGFSISTHEKRKKEFSSSKATQEYEFSLKDGKGDVWKCQSVTGCNQSYVDVILGKKTSLAIGVTSESSFVCTFRSENRPEVWRLMINENVGSSSGMKGVLSDGKISIAIQGTRKLAGTPFPLSDPSGYEFLMNEHIVSSVEVINKGAVWIVPSIEERLHSPLAVTSAALLLYQDIGRK
ncbi:MAG: hypothetical protein ACYSWP_14600 [Planctomycetota bacterium]